MVREIKRGCALPATALALQAGADPNRATTQGKATALHRAAYLGARRRGEAAASERGGRGAANADGLSALQKAGRGC